MKIKKYFVIFFLLWTFGETFVLAESSEKVSREVGQVDFYLKIEGSFGSPAEQKILIPGTIPKFGDFFSQDMSFGGLVLHYQNEGGGLLFNSTIANSTAKLQEFANQKFLADVPYEIVFQEVTKFMLFQLPDLEHSRIILAEAGRQMSFDQKLYFISNLGAIFSANYDHDRAADGTHAKGIIELEKLLLGARGGVPAGICRDIAVGQAQILNMMGVDSHVVIFSTRGSGHATLVATDPNNRSKVAKINYGKSSETEGGAGSAETLRQDTTLPDTGIKFLIADHNGKPIATVPTELGLFLEQALVGRVNHLSPLIREANSIISTGVAGSAGEIKVYRGQTPSGDVVQGGGLVWRDENKKGGSYRAAMGYANIQRKGHYIKDSTSDLIYISVYSKSYTPMATYKVKDQQITIAGFVEFDAQLLFGNVKQSGPNGTHLTGLTTDSNFQSAVGTEINWKGKDSPLELKLGAKAVVSAFYQDIRSADFRDVRPYLKHFIVNYLLSSELNQHTKLYYGADFVLSPYDIGGQQKQYIGVDTHLFGLQSKVSVGYQGQIYGKTFSYIPGSLDELFTEVEIKANSKLDLGGSVICQIDNFKNCWAKAAGKLRLPIGWDLAVLNWLAN